MSAPTTRIVTPTRIVALALCGLAVLGLSYLRFAPGGERVSVPAGAHAGQLAMNPCHYSTEDGSYEADCGTLVVPENRHDSRSRLIAVPVTRIHARSAHPGAPVFRLEGGPGKTNMTFPQASRYAADRDVVLVGYRGVDGSARLDCPEVESALKSSADFLTQKSFGAYAAAFRACAGRLQASGVDLGGYSIPERVDDLEAARHAFGYGRIDLLSESAGTRTALVYAWRYPKSIERSVLVGVNPPGNFLWYPRQTNEQIRKYAALCAKDSSCSARTSDLVSTLENTTIPSRWIFLPIQKGNVRIATFYGMVHATSSAAPISAPMTIGSWLSAAHGDASGFWLMSLLPHIVFPQVFVWGEMASFAGSDRAAAGRFFAQKSSASIIGRPSDFIWGGGKLVSAWPAGPDDNAYSRVRASSVPTLVVNGDLDFATPPQNPTRELMPYLRNGREIVLPNMGHTDDFWQTQIAAGTHLVNTYLGTGKVDASRYVSKPVDFTPSVSQGAIAKIVLAAMLGFAGLAVLSLLWVGHRRGRLGRKSSAVLRTALPVVLGLGGWFAGLLVVLVALPALSIDSEVLAVLSIGIPVALGIYWAWVERDAPSWAKTTGTILALAGALAGAWFGFQSTAGLIAVVATIVGATAGANVALIVLGAAQATVVTGAGPHPGDGVGLWCESVDELRHHYLSSRRGPAGLL